MVWEINNQLTETDLTLRVSFTKWFEKKKQANTKRINSQFFVRNNFSKISAKLTEIGLTLSVSCTKFSKYKRQTNEERINAQCFFFKIFMYKIYIYFLWFFTKDSFKLTQTFQVFEWIFLCFNFGIVCNRVENLILDHISRTE